MSFIHILVELSKVKRIYANYNVTAVGIYAVILSQV